MSEQNKEKLEGKQLYDNLCKDFEDNIKNELLKDPSRENFLRSINAILNFHETVIKSTLAVLYKRGIKEDTLKEIVRKMHREAFNEIKGLLAEEDKL